jgi:hypothetical protein
MKTKGIKFICERRDGEITTWYDIFNTKVEDIINKVKYDKDWIGGKFLEIYIELDLNGVYYKVNLDLQNSKYNQLLGS